MTEMDGFYARMGKFCAVNFNDQSYEDEVELIMNDYELLVRDDGKIYACKKPTCPFCKMKNESNHIYENNSFFAVYDQYPVTYNHALIISKRHVERYFPYTDSSGNYIEGLTETEKADLIDAINGVQSIISRNGCKDFNVGFNNGKFAGQTVNHFHCHVIPRYDGDTEDPKGGIRGCVPERMKYEI